jgi:hypothetical protein
LLGTQPICQYDRLVHVRLAQFNELSLRDLSLVSGFGRLAPGLFPEAAADL